MTKSTINRRVILKSSALGLLTAITPNVLFAKEGNLLPGSFMPSNGTYAGYPAIADEVVSKVVGVSHFDLEQLKLLVNPRPELAIATWDWGFGDFETALGAASHVGRKDIAEFLMSHGARPDIFTYAMFGEYNMVKSMIDLHPGRQRHAGPHGISLLQHVKNAIEANGTNDNYKKLLDYLEALGDADGPRFEEVTEAEMNTYTGDYRYGDGELDGFSVKITSRKTLSFGKLGKFGGVMQRTGDHRFAYRGAPSVEISFQWEGDKIISLTLKEPGLTLVARRV